MKEVKIELKDETKSKDETLNKDETKKKDESILKDGSKNKSEIEAPKISSMNTLVGQVTLSFDHKAPRLPSRWTIDALYQMYKKTNSVKT